MWGNVQPKDGRNAKIQSNMGVMYLTLSAPIPKMVKHTQTIHQLTVDELFECI